MRYQIAYKLLLMCAGMTCALLSRSLNPVSASGVNHYHKELVKPVALAELVEANIIQYPAHMLLYSNCVEKIPLQWIPSGTSAGESITATTAIKPTTEGITVRTSDSLFASAELVTSTGTKAAFFSPKIDLLEVPLPEIVLNCPQQTGDKPMVSRAKCECSFKVVPDAHFAKLRPDEVTYSLNRFEVLDRGCFGSPSIANYTAADLNVTNPVIVSMCSYLSQSNSAIAGSMFIVQLDSLFRHSADGALHYVPISHQSSQLHFSFLGR